MQIFETPHDCWTDVHIALNEVIVYTETYGDVELDLSYWFQNHAKFVAF